MSDRDNRRAELRKKILTAVIEKPNQTVNQLVDSFACDGLQSTYPSRLTVKNNIKDLAVFGYLYFLQGHFIKATKKGIRAIEGQSL